MWTPVIWTFVFIAINGYWIVRLTLERRPVHLTSDEQRLRKLAFPSLTPREAINLYKMGMWEDMSPGSPSLSTTTRSHGFRSFCPASPMWSSAVEKLRNLAKVSLWEISTRAPATWATSTSWSEPPCASCVGHADNSKRFSRKDLTSRSRSREASDCS